MKYLLTAFLLVTGCAYAQKAKNYSSVTDELSTKIIATVPSGKSLHVAVVPFSATSASVEQSAAFGDYLTETIIGSLTGQPDKIKLFERTRLDAVLKEQQFILTDLMKPAAALKIGQLVPIDALLSGTYTKLKSYIDVNARLIDVATGEISVSFNGRIKMTKNLATLFKQDGAQEKDAKAGDKNSTVTISFSGGSSTTAKSRAEICKQKAEEFKVRLNDLTTAEKIGAVVTEARKTPFDNVCGQLHYSTMYSFTRYKIDNAEYKSFLLQTLDTIAFPGEDDRALEIARFVSADGQVDEREWTVALKAMSRVGNYTLNSFNSVLIAKPASPEFPVMQKRIDSFFELASAGKIGLPRPISFESAFFSMLDGLRGNQSLRQYVYATYASKLSIDDRAKSNLFSALTNMYKEESVHKTDIMKWIIGFVNSNDYAKAPDQLYEFAYHFRLDPNYPGRNEEIWREYPASDLALLIDGAREKFSRYATQTQYGSQRDDRIAFCVVHDIAVPGVIPTMDEADVILKGSDVAEQQRVTAMLAEMGDRPRKLEGSLIGLLAKRSLDDRDKLAAAQTSAIKVLGNIKTANPKAIEYMIGVLPHYGNDTEAAEIALVQIGKPAVAQLTSRLDKTTVQDGGLQFQLITILGKIGKSAATAEKSVTRVLNATNNADIKYAAEAALQIFRD